MLIQQPHSIYSCPVCRDVVALRAQAARLWQEQHPGWYRTRCTACGFLGGRHAPDCSMALRLRDIIGEEATAI